MLDEAGKKLDLAFGTFYVGDKQYNTTDFRGAIVVTKAIGLLKYTLTLDYADHPGNLALLVTT